MKLVERLRQEKYWLLDQVSQNEISLVKSMGGKVITIRLLRTGNNKYKVIFPSYIFHSQISHFAPKEDEHRNCRNKVLLMSLIKVLKRSLIWDYVDNQDFLTINDHNKKANKSKLQKELSLVIGKEISE